MAEFDKKNTGRIILSEGKTSAFQKYRLVTVGDVGFAEFLYYELVTMLLGPMPGAIGLVLRKIFYKRMFKQWGSNVIIGRNCVIRHPAKISIGNGVLIDDDVLLDAKGGDGEGIVLNNNAMVFRSSSLIVKAGSINIGEGVGIGSGSSFVSWAGISIGQGTAIAGGCFISGGSYRIDDFDTPINERSPYTNGPVDIGKNVWIATRVTILDGVKIGENSILSACSVISSNVKPKVVVHGDPAKVIFKGR